ncbi:fatty acid hydroxylase-like protein [Aureococcus anophagefferens]|nr:fatty acid hydroxylase-like protein [Aureococcus anophagefferens]
MAWYVVVAVYGSWDDYPGALGGAASHGYAWSWMGRDFLVATQSMFCAAAVECWLCRLWASGTLASAPSLELSAKNVFLILTLTHWRIPHFWLIHRGMHPWKAKGVPDVGKFLYKHVHSLHHKSSNPTAFSGTNMHPVEATLYFSAALLVVPLGVHPSIPLACVVDCAVGAWLGHDGFQWPGSGDYFHQLHHAHFDCNYGAMHVPIDKWLGTYAGCKEDLKAIWGKRAADRAKVGKDGTKKA